MKKEKLFLQLRKKADGTHAQDARTVEWVSAEPEANGERAVCRLPQEQKHTCERKTFFAAAGRIYPSVRALTALPLNGKKGVYLDVFGRKVLQIRERFPIFDFGDSVSERRYFRWVYILRGDSLTCVYYEDDSSELEIIEDVSEIPGRQWRRLMENEVVSDAEVQLLKL